VKIYIGPYTTWVGPYQIAEKMLFWMDKDTDDTVHQFGEWLAGSKDKPSLLSRFCEWVENKKKRNIKIHIDRYDLCNADHTLALVILPVLKQLKELQHVAPYTENEDAPEEFHSISKENDYDVDEHHYDRWNWILDQMIWSFETKIADDTETLYGLHWQENHDRMQNGFRLFGKYYQGLWI